VHRNSNTMPGPELYAVPMSPPCRAINMTLDYLGIDYNYHMIDLQKGETRTPEFLALNPQHTVPVLCDVGDLVICESRAAMTYLINKYKPNHPLYPTDPAKRAMIDARLYFNIGTFYSKFGDCVYPVALGMTEDGKIQDMFREAFKEVLVWVDQMTAGGFVLGDSITLADLDFMSTMSSLEACDFMDLTPYKNLTAWSAKMKKTLPKYAENCHVGAGHYGAWFNASYKRD